MPGDGTREAHFVVAQLQRATAAYKAGGILLTDAAHAFSAELWSDNSRRVLEAAGCVYASTLYDCPPYGLVVNTKIMRAMQTAFLRPQALLYFALHGLHREPQWWGHPVHLPPWQEALLPQKAAMVDNALVAAAVPAGSVVCAAVCQAGALFGRNANTSLALRFLREGALCLLAPTTQVYEYVPDTPRPLDGIDKLFADVLRGLVNGLPTGQALVQAKREHALLGLEDEKNVHSLVLYGDPGLTVRLQGVM
jgi:hypothetical protein